MEINDKILPEGLRKRLKRFRKAPKKYETELEILHAEIEEKHPFALIRTGSRTPEIPSGLQGLFAPIDAPPSKGIDAPTIRLKGDIGEWFGEIELFEYSVVLRGDKGAGKSRLLFQIMNAFAEARKSVCLFTLEMDASSKLIADYRERYVRRKNRPRIVAASEAPEGLETIRKAAEAFDVVCIDSWQKIRGVRQEDFDALRKRYKNTVFIIIFQSNAQGGTRGGNMADYDAQAVCHVKPGGRAVWEKNRFCAEPLVYRVFEGRLEKKEEPEKKE